MKEYNETLQERLKIALITARKKRGLTANKAYECTGVFVATLESARYNKLTSLWTMQRVANALDYDLEIKLVAIEKEPVKRVPWNKGKKKGQV